MTSPAEAVGLETLCDATTRRATKPLAPGALGLLLPPQLPINTMAANKQGKGAILFKPKLLNKTEFQS